MLQCYLYWLTTTLKPPAVEVNNTDHATFSLCVCRISPQNTSVTEDALANKHRLVSMIQSILNMQSIEDLYLMNVLLGYTMLFFNNKSDICSVMEMLILKNVRDA